MQEMKYLKTYQLFESQSVLTPEQEEFLNKYTKGTWTYDSSTGLVDVEGDFDCSKRGALIWYLSGVKFGKVSGDFDCASNHITSLEGAPQEVGGHFYCYDNKLTSLEGAPQKVGGEFDCSHNKLANLEGAPQEVDGGFVCTKCKLTSLEGAPKEVGGFFDCRFNDLTSLVGSPEKVGGSFECYGNEDMTSLKGAPREIDGFFKGGYFHLKPGQWNPEGWLKVLDLELNREKARHSIASLLTPEILNKEIQKDPAGMIMKLKEIWNDDNFKETRDKLVWPTGYGDSADLVGDLDDVGF